tara:strand:+ start:847 stop:1074 length:228 start_codon:yes stop_codon:yes gene_type:complete
MSDSRSRAAIKIERAIGALFCIAAAMMLFFGIPTELYEEVEEMDKPVTLFLSGMFLIAAGYLLREGFKQEDNEEE